MPASRVERVTVVLTMDDGNRAVYLLEGDANSEVTVTTEVNYREIPGQMLVREEVASYDLTFEFKEMVTSDMRREAPSAPAIEAGKPEITDSAGR